MTILGISASGREAGITSEVVKGVLEATGEPYEYISLAGPQIGGCRGCTRCAADSCCMTEDDWLAVGEKMLSAEAMVFGHRTTMALSTLWDMLAGSERSASVIARCPAWQGS